MLNSVAPQHRLQKVHAAAFEQEFVGTGVAEVMAAKGLWLSPRVTRLMIMRGNKEWLTLIDGFRIAVMALAASA